MSAVRHQHKCRGYKRVLASACEHLAEVITQMSSTDRIAIIVGTMDS